MPTYVLNSDEYKKALKDKTLTKDDVIELKSGKTRPPNTMKEMKAIRDYELKKEEESKKAEEPEELVIPKPLKSPENLTPVIGRIKDDVEELRTLGKTYGGVYQTDSGLSWFAYLAVLKKFKVECYPIYTDYFNNLILGIRIHIETFYSSAFDSTNNIFNDDYSIGSLGSELKKCVKRKIEVIPIFLGIDYDTEKEKKAHANILIYRPFEKIVERFEPHGSSTRMSLSNVSEKVDGQVKKVFKRLEDYIGDVKYVPPNEICPVVKGFQSIESQLKKIDSGFCLMWSLFFMEMVLYNPTKTSSEIIDDILKLSQSDPQYMTDVIRGYVMGLEKMLDETLKFFKKEGFSFAVLKSNKDKDKETFTEDMIRDFTLSSMFDVHLSEILSEVEDELQKLKIDYNERNVGKLIDMLYNFSKESIREIGILIFGETRPEDFPKNDIISNIIINTYKYEKMDDLLLFKPESMSKFRKLTLKEQEEKENKIIKDAEKILDVKYVWFKLRINPNVRIRDREATIKKEKKERQEWAEKFHADLVKNEKEWEEWDKSNKEVGFNTFKSRDYKEYLKSPERETMTFEEYEKRKEEYERDPERVKEKLEKIERRLKESKKRQEEIERKEKIARTKAIEEANKTGYLNDKKDRIFSLIKRYFNFSDKMLVRIGELMETLGYDLQPESLHHKEWKADLIYVLIKDGIDNNNLSQLEYFEEKNKDEWMEDKPPFLQTEEEKERAKAKAEGIRKWKERRKKEKEREKEKSDKEKEEEKERAKAKEEQEKEGEREREKEKEEERAKAKADKEKEEEKAKAKAPEEEPKKKKSKEEEKVKAKEEEILANLREEDEEEFDDNEDTIKSLVDTYLRVFSIKMLIKVSKLLETSDFPEGPYNEEDRVSMIIAIIKDVLSDQNLSHLSLFKPENKDKWMKLKTKDFEEYLEGDRPDIEELFGSGSEYTEKKKCKLTGGMVCECQKLSVWDWF